MRRCPECATTYPDSARFCEHDGTRLVEAPEASGATGAVSGRQATRRLETLPPRPAPATGPVSHAATPHAANAHGAGAQGTGPLAPEAYGGPYAHSGPIAAPRSRTGPRVAVGLLVVVALALSGVGAYLFLKDQEAAMQEEEIATRFEAALAEGLLVEPEGESAYDWYTRLQSEFPYSARLASYQGQVLPELQSRLDRFYDRWMQTSDANDSEWPTIRRMAKWGYEMAPQSGRLRAQHLYADARNAFENGDTAGAETQYRAAIEAWPEWALPYNSLGVLMARRKSYREAAGWYQKATQRSGDWAFPHTNLGGTYIHLGQFADAERALDRASDLRPGNGAAWANLSNAYIDAERYADAQRAARRALSEGGRGYDRQRMSDRVSYLDLYLQGYDDYYDYQEFISAYNDGTLGDIYYYGD